MGRNRKPWDRGFITPAATRSPTVGIEPPEAPTGWFYAGKDTAGKFSYQPTNGPVSTNITGWPGRGWSLETGKWDTVGTEFRYVRTIQFSAPELATVAMWWSIEKSLELEPEYRHRPLFTVRYNSGGGKLVENLTQMQAYQSMYGPQLQNLPKGHGMEVFHDEVVITELPTTYVELKDFTLTNTFTGDTDEQASDSGGAK